MEAVAVLASIATKLTQHQENEEKADQAEEDLYMVLGMAGTTIGVGTLCFHHFQQHWSRTDAFYFSVISATSVGLGDLVPIFIQPNFFVIWLIYITMTLGMVATAISKLQEMDLKINVHHLKKLSAQRSFDMVYLKTKIMRQEWHKKTKLANKPIESGETALLREKEEDAAEGGVDGGAEVGSGGGVKGGAGTPPVEAAEDDVGKSFEATPLRHAAKHLAKNVTRIGSGGGSGQGDWEDGKMSAGILSPESARRRLERARQAAYAQGRKDAQEQALREANQQAYAQGLRDAKVQVAKEAAEDQARIKAALTLIDAKNGPRQLEKEQLELGNVVALASPAVDHVRTTAEPEAPEKWLGVEEMIAQREAEGFTSCIPRAGLSSYREVFYATDDEPYPPSHNSGSDDAMPSHSMLPFCNEGVVPKDAAVGMGTTMRNRRVGAAEHPLEPAGPNNQWQRTEV
jgi:hypothetical protein